MVQFPNINDKLIPLNSIEILPNTPVTFNKPEEIDAFREHTRYVGLETPIYMLDRPNRVNLLLEEERVAFSEYNRRFEEEGYEDGALHNYVHALMILRNRDYDELLDRVTKGHAEVSRYQDIRFKHRATGQTARQYVDEQLRLSLQNKDKELGKLQARYNIIPMMEKLRTAEYYLELQAITESLKDLMENNPELGMWYMYAELFPPLQQILLHSESIFNEWAKQPGVLPISPKVLEQHDWAILSIMCKSTDLVEYFKENEISSADQLRDLFVKGFTTFMNEPTTITSVTGSNSYRMDVDVKLEEALGKINIAATTPNSY